MTGMKNLDDIVLSLCEILFVTVVLLCFLLEWQFRHAKSYSKRKS